MGTAIMLLQEVRNWQSGQGVLPDYELYTDLGVDTAVAIPRDYACDVRECVLSKKVHVCCHVCNIWNSVHLLCHGDVSQDDLCLMLSEMEHVVINLRRRHHTSRIVFGSDLNVSLAPNLEGLTGSLHSSQYQCCFIALERSSDRVDALTASESRMHVRL